MNQIIKLTELFAAVVAREVKELEREGLISIRCDWNNKIDIHVTKEYFAEHFSDRECKYTNQPMHNKIKVSFATDSGNEIFCLQDAKFERVA